MKSEFTANTALDLADEKKRIEAFIKSYVGIVPASLYERLDQIEIKLSQV